MDRRQFLAALVGTAAAATLPTIGCAQEKTVIKTNIKPNGSAKPNIIYILIDDLGPEWISCYGAEDIKTPNIDALATGGMRFTNAYSMPQCTPTRTTLLTGQYPFRTGWVNHFDVPRWGKGCHFDEKYNITFARVLKEAGYSTAAAGKWQINDFRVEPDAMVKHGFDEYCMWTGGEGGNTEISGERYWDPYIHTKEGSKTYKGKFGADVFTDFIVDFIKKNKEKPMCVYFPMALTHLPFTTTPFEPEVKDSLGKHKAMVHYVDYCVKRIVDTLNETGLREKTIVFVCGDNGTTGRMTGHINGRAIKGGKAKITENGIWTPFVVNCPGVVSGGVVTDTLTDFTDMMPTFVELAGAKLPEGVTIDGHSIAKVLLGKEKDGTRKWIMAMGHGPAGFKDGRVCGKKAFEERAIRDKRYKIHVSYDRVTTKLYDLQEDPGEKNNLIDSTKPEHVAAKQKLEAVWKAMPEKDAAPKYDKLPPQEWEKKEKGNKKGKGKRTKKGKVSND